MIDESKRRLDEAAKRLSDLREGGKKSALPVRESSEPDGEENEEAEGGCFSVLSAARMQKLMVEFRFKDGNAKALAYSYLVGTDFDPSADIVMDFAGSSDQRSPASSPRSESPDCQATIGLRSCQAVRSWVGLRWKKISFVEKSFEFGIGCIEVRRHPNLPFELSSLPRLQLRPFWVIGGEYRDWSLVATTDNRISLLDLLDQFREVCLGFVDIDDVQIYHKMIINCLIWDKFDLMSNIFLDEII
jgi:hypothetical protein